MSNQLEQDNIGRDRESTLFRSVEMSKIQLFVPYESSHASLTILGELGMVEFDDLNEEVSSFQRNFVEEIKRIDELSRKTRWFNNQIELCEEIINNPLRPAMSTDSLNTPGGSELSPLQKLDNLESNITERYNKLQDLSSNISVLQMNYEYYILKGEVMDKLDLIINIGHSATFGNELTLNNNEDEQPLLSNAEDIDGTGGVSGQEIGFVAGVIERSKTSLLERILWRSLRGNVFLRHESLNKAYVPLSSKFIQSVINSKSNDKDLGKDNFSSEKVYYDVFVAFVHGDALLKKVRKIASLLGGIIYDDLSTNELDRRQLKLQTTNKCDDLYLVLENTKRTMTMALNEVSNFVHSWEFIIKRERAIYHTLNCLSYDHKRKCLIGEGWCPSPQLDYINRSLKITQDSRSSMAPIITTLPHPKPSKQLAPTYNINSTFTQGFQNIVDSYGTASYGEVNPALFTIISFPFLFAVMFGDFGHGFLMTLAALYLVVNERTFMKKNLGEMFDMLFGGRYIVLLMGIFSMYTGIIYNDIFSRSIPLFSSRWSYSHGNREAVQNGVYPIGLDPAWHSAENGLIFSNSYKMKMSVLMGVAHMTFGIILTTYNYRHFKKIYSIFLEFIPQIIFMQSIFGYLCVTILYKWLVDWSARDKNGELIHGNPPGLLNMLIYMFLTPGTINPAERLFNGQEMVQTILLSMALICVPVMLFGKPIFLAIQNSRRQANYANISGEEGPQEEEEEFEFGEIMIHQSIHTIEFCLGCISNTASYLRLWALSLAHAQLSIVLWDMTIANILTIQNRGTFIVALVIGGTLWLSLTIAILMIMEGLSAFLHALRLHWVEFNNKFYSGTGRPFIPFDFSSL